VAAHGLKPEEYQRFLKLIGREPTITELGIVSAMWNEHCSYKSSRLHLRKLPTKGRCVIQGPGENAGVIDIGDNEVAIFKMESHNHPSYIEPFQGAATGVGGILRDVFTMGARPIACMNALRFGAPEHPKTKHLVSGVVAGIGAYGNSFGVPTVGGEVNFHSRYDGNCLVNAFALGIAKKDAIFYAKAAGIGMPIVYLGSKTGRDGIHGATMASAGFDESSDDKRPTVQVGDPFAEKLLLEACLELMQQDAIIAIQDMGAAGLTCSAVEMGAKGNLGIELELDNVPCREAGMTAYEMMLSESQERMLMVLKPEKEALARKIFTKWELDFAVIGKTTDSLRFVVKHHGEVKADLPIKQLGDEAPLYERPFKRKTDNSVLAVESVPAPASLTDMLVRLMGTPDLCSRRWVWEQYDHIILGNILQRPGGDAAVVRIDMNRHKALALTCDVTPRYCFADPYEGGKQAVAEAWRNLTCVGATPLSITDNLNFGSPEDASIMGEFVGCVEGIAEACKVLNFPVVSGNVSLYNENRVTGDAILPTPTIGGVGLLDDCRKMATIAFKSEDEEIILIGETTGWLGQSIYLREIIGEETGAPPPVNLDLEKKHGDFVRALIDAGRVTACHDCSDGGLLVAIGEMALAGGLGAKLEATDHPQPHAFWFGEDQARYVVTTPLIEANKILIEAKNAGIPAQKIGKTAGMAIELDGEAPLPLSTLRQSHEGWLPAFMKGEL
jgi:phosphoribosylformylglycinamidine synthase II